MTSYFSFNPEPNRNAHAPAVDKLMRSVMLALLPGTLAYILFINATVLIQILLCCSATLATEAAVLKLRNRDLLPSLSDGSALLAGWLLALAIPAIAPWWIAVVGGITAMLLGKHLFGGLGSNPFNPAMLAYAFLLVSFPLQMTLWPIDKLADAAQPTRLATSVQLIWETQASSDPEWHAVTRATPLDRLKNQDPDNNDLYGWFALQAWEWVNLGWLLGGLWMLWRRIITWHIPVCVLAALASAHGVHWLIAEQALNPFAAVFSGAAMLGAFFIATDPVSAATSPRGRIVFALGIGFLTFVIREFSNYPEGIAFAVLLMNSAAPALDHYLVKTSSD